MNVSWVKGACMGWLSPVRDALTNKVSYVFACALVYLYLSWVACGFSASAHPVCACPPAGLLL